MTTLRKRKPAHRWASSRHPTKYNKWALYVAMNMESSDHSAVLQKWSEGDPDKYAEACYDLAVSQLNDKDKPKWIREYFKL